MSKTVQSQLAERRNSRCRQKGGDTGSTVPLVAHVIHRFEIGGLENGLVNLINQTPANRYRHAVVCLTRAGPMRRRIEIPGVPVYELGKREGLDPGIYFRLWKVFRNLRPAIVHTRNLGTLDAVPVAALAGVRCRVHAEHGRDMPDLHGRRFRYRVLRRSIRPWITAYAAVSPDLAEWLERIVAQGRRRVVFLPNGVDLHRFHPRNRTAEEVPDWPFRNGDEVVVGTVSRLEPVKDPLTLFRAFRLVQDRRPGLAGRLRLVFAGSGSLRGSLEKEVRQAGLGSHVWLAGARDDVPALLRRFDCFALSSLAEGCSNTVLEAMATGLPVVATRVGGTPALVEEGKTGLLVPPDNPEAFAGALLRYLDDPGLRERHGLSARLRAEREFGLDAMADRYLRFYDELLGKAAE